MELNSKLKELEAQNNGDYWIVKCPKCGHKEAYIYLNDVEKYKKIHTFKIPIRCNRLNKCGATSFIEDIDIHKIPKFYHDDSIGISKIAIDKINNLAYLSKYLNHFEFDWRGISNKTLKENGIIYLKKGLLQFMKGCGKGAFDEKFYKKRCYKDRNLIFPIKDYEGNCERLLLRSTKMLDVKAKKEIGMKLVKKSSEVWNRIDLVDMSKSHVFVTEGVPDGLSIKEVSQNFGVVSIPGVKKYKQIIKEIEKSEVARKKKYILCFDDDEAGKEFVHKLASYLENNNIEFTLFDLHSYKDVNEFLQKDRHLFFKTVNQNINNEQKEGVEDEIAREIKSETKFRFTRKKGRKFV